MVLLYFVFLGVCQATGPNKNVFGQSETNWNDVTGEAMVGTVDLVSCVWSTGIASCDLCLVSVCVFVFVFACVCV